MLPKTSKYPAYAILNALACHFPTYFWIGTHRCSKQQGCPAHCAPHAIQAQRYKYFCYTVAELKSELCSLQGDASGFAKAKSKEDKTDMVLNVWFRSTWLDAAKQLKKKEEAEKGKGPSKEEAEKGKVPSKEVAKQGKEPSKGDAKKGKGPSKEEAEQEKAKKEKELSKGNAKKGKPIDPKNVQTSESNAAFQDLLSAKADVEEGVIAETPEYLSKILILEEKWLELILSGQKTIELRKSRLTSSAQEVLYLAVGNEIHGRALFSGMCTIDTLSAFEKLGGHKCTTPPYAFPFVGHKISKVQRLEKIKFLKLQGCQGRSLYRPLNWTPEFDLKLKKDTEEGHIPEDGEDTLGENGTKAKTKAAGKKKITDWCNLLPSKALSQSQVEIVDTSKHFEPSSARLEQKMAFLRQKTVQADLHISGGCLAHLNNVAFPRAPLHTVGVLLGILEKKATMVKALWVPRWEMQEKLAEVTLADQDMQDFCDSEGFQVVGICLVQPKFDSPDLCCFEELSQIWNKQEHNFSFAVTCADRKTTFFRVDENGAGRELSIQVHWTGKLSYYQATVASHQLQSLQSLRSSAVEAVAKQKLGVRARVKKQEQNLSRRPKPETRQLIVEQSLEVSCQELGEVASFLVSKLAGFQGDTLQSTIEEFNAFLAAHATAKRELFSVLPDLKAPSSVVEAGQLLASISKVKESLEIRRVQRSQNRSHTFDGSKYSKRSASTSGLSTPQTTSTNKSRRCGSYGSSSSQKANELDLEETG